jgi:serine/threonine-protein kinase
MSPDSTTSGKSSTSTDSTAGANSAELNTGMMVGEYRVEGQLGSGPSGRVHSAVHAAISRRAAIKVLHPEIATSREALEKFFAEVRAANQLGHPNVVDIFAFGKLADGRSYVVMEWLRGESLRERARRTRMPIAEGLALISSITLALAEAHEKGIIHRDLKPENVFLVEVKGERPQVKLLDFGTAELLGTRAEQRVGTSLPYVSPEQARGDTVDGKSDIYALGAIAYELVTGKPVFEGKTASDIIKKHLDEKPKAASSLNSEVPAQLDALIAAMLAKSPADRPSLEKIRSELRACRLLVGGALTPPAGVPIVPAGSTGGSVPAAKSPTGDTAKQADAATAKDTPTKGRDSRPGIAKEPARPTAPQSSSGVWVALALLLAGAIGIGIWIYMNQREDQPVDTSAPAAAPTDPAVAPAAGSNAGSEPVPTTFGAPVPPPAGSAAPADPDASPGSAAPGSAAAGSATVPAAAPGSAAPAPAAEAIGSAKEPRKHRHRKSGSGSSSVAPATSAPAPAPAP